ncbi:hypothetical protein POVWA2_022650 [Plasmodium ovale wallikeri]|uniref:Uncharacterized protein n=1 Tax=Plasmodium ovale wallikeri TaxID=864142 RepID=A0A1A8YTI9_PLAOA|nr:hypothetical protein POVWA2_022650 [Plasmodium ovale wallikeri]
MKKDFFVLHSTVGKAQKQMLRITMHVARVAPLHTNANGRYKLLRKMVQKRFAYLMGDLNDAYVGRETKSKIGINLKGVGSIFCILHQFLLQTEHVQTYLPLFAQKYTCTCEQAWTTQLCTYSK